MATPKRVIHVNAIPARPWEKWRKGDFVVGRFVGYKLDTHYRHVPILKISEVKWKYARGQNSFRNKYLEISQFGPGMEVFVLLEHYADKIDWAKVQEQIDSGDHLKLPYEKRACVFLRDDECSVYEHRPNSCRKYFVASDPDKCDSSKYPGGEVDTLYSHKAELFASALMTLQDCGPMAHMLAKVLDKKK